MILLTGGLRYLERENQYKKSGELEPTQKIQPPSKVPGIVADGKQGWSGGK